MSCSDEWGLALSKFVDSEVTLEEKRQVEAHLPTCPVCRDTLELFRRNEKALESALAGEAFGDQVVEGVMAEVRRLEIPPVVAPALEGRSWADSIRRAWPLASAAALLLAAGGILLFRSGTGEHLAESVSALQRQIEHISEAHQTERIILADQVRRLEGELQDAVARSQGGTDRTTFARFTQRRSIAVRATFSALEQYATFSAQRSSDGMKSWELLAKSLTKSEYEDRNVEEGRPYHYQFIGHRRDGTETHSEPILMRLPVPGQMDPETSLKVTFFACQMDMKKATFLIERYHEGQPKSEWFTVGVGQKIGGVVAGIDYTSSLILDQLTAADETLASGASPGAPAIAITRQNRLAKLRAAGSSAGEATRDIWRGSSVLVPLPESK